MTEFFVPGAPDIPIVLRRSARARRISLRVSRLDGRVTLTLPNRVPESEALEFAQSKADWLVRNMAARPEAVQVTLGTELPFQGELLTVGAGQGRSVKRDGEALLVPSGTRVGARVQAFLKTEARNRLVEACDGYSQALGRSYARITLRDTRSRWGSCSSAGALMFSWRLVLAPEEVLHYVAAHEVAHLAQMNHSKAFWDEVHTLFGPHKAERTWLRQHGEKLHRYRFED
ncbi:SprT family zinc-dependent metalloprotease [Cognatishimia sp. D5M38]|uniref:SprT family zinc-dependent metalloprotease n=1 Tax=Cognatishimia coralii TaxID=3083254 RepID=A0ABU8QHM2_9RHOB